MTKKSIWVAVLLLVVLAIASSITALVVVLTAGVQYSTSEVNVDYKANDVYLKISANYYLDSTPIAMVNGSDTELTLSPLNRSGSLNQPNVEGSAIQLSPDNGGKIIFEYIFENLSPTVPAVISQSIDSNGNAVVPTDTYNNVSISYKGTASKLGAGAYASSTTLNNIAIPAGETKYLYVIISVDNLMRNVKLTGSFGWVLDRATVVDKDTDSTTGDKIINISTDQSYVNDDELDDINLVLDCENESPKVYPIVANKCFTGWYTKDESGNETEVEWPAMITSTTKIYPKYVDETSGLSYTYTGDGYAVIGGYKGSTNDIFIPDVHNDGTHGNARITSIAGSAFKGNSTIVDVVIPNTVTSIGDSVFGDCSNLRILYIPKSVISIGNNLLVNDSKLETITVESGNPNYDSRNNCNAIIESAKLTLISGCKNTIVPEGIVTIGNNSFQGISSLQEINLPDTVKILDTSCLQQTGLTSVVLPNSLTTINGYAFYLAPIEEFYIPASVNYIGNLALCTSRTNSIVVSSANTKYDSRDNCNSVIETASNRLIAGCNKSTIPNTVTAIGYYAFQRCKELTSIHIPSSVVTIGQALFDGCTNLATLTVDEDNPKYDSRNNCNAIVETATNTIVQGIATSTVPEGIKAIGDKAFQGVSFGSLTLPNSLETIGVQAFYQTSLKSINIPKNVNKINVRAFGYCHNLVSITVDAGNTVYDNRNNCNSVIETATNTLVVGCTTSTIPNTVTAIGDYAFYVVYISNLTIPSSVTTIGEESLRYSRLESVVIPSSVISIGNYAFGNMSRLKSATIGSGVVNIGLGVFNNCPLLNSVIFSNTTGWKVYSNTNYTDGIDVEVSSTDTFYNSTLFKSIYLNKYWKRG